MMVSRDPGREGDGHDGPPAAAGRFGTARRDPLQPLIVPVGPWDPRSMAEERPGAHVLFLKAGSIHREHVIADRAVSDLLGPGDTISLTERLMGPPLPRIEIRFTVLEEARVVVLDDPATRVLCEHPEVAADMIVLAADQAARLAALRALGHLPRVEQRVLAFFSVMAERVGRVTADGILIPLSLSHERIGRHVAAQRSTVSLALKALAEDGLVIREAEDRWLLPRAIAGEPMDLADVSPASSAREAPDAEPDATPGIEGLRERVVGLRRQYDRARRRLDRFETHR